MIGSLWVGRRGAPSKEGFDHVGDDGTRLGEVEGGDGRIHLIETLAAAQKFGIDRADLVEHLLQFAEVDEELRRPGRKLHWARSRAADARPFERL